MDLGCMQQYRTIHRVCEPLLGSSKAFDEEEQDSRVIDMAIHRRLCHAVHNPMLDKFYTNSQRARACMDKFYHKGGDHGATLVLRYHQTSPYPSLLWGPVCVRPVHVLPLTQT